MGEETPTNGPSLAEELAKAKERITELTGWLDLARQDVGFYKCCALSGEIPEVGSEPSAQEQSNDNR